MKKLLFVTIIAFVICTVVGVVAKVATPESQYTSKKTYEVVSDVSHGDMGDISKLKKGSSVTVTLEAAEGYALPETITVTGATYEYDRITGNLTLSNPVGQVSVEVVCVPITYTVSITLTNGTSSGATSITYGGTATVTLSASTGYILPSSVTVSGATYTYDSTTGMVLLSAPTGNVTISGACTANTYTVSTTLTNGTSSGATSIAYGGTATVALSASTGYTLPSTVTVTGASHTYDSTTGVVSLSAPTDNVTISGACTANTYTVSTTLTNGTSSGATSIAYGGTATVTLSASMGYTLPSTVTVTGATHIYDSTTGVVSLSAPTGNVTISGVCTANTYTVSTTLTNGTSSGATSIAYGGTATVTLLASTGHTLPSTVTVTGATHTYDSTTGVVSLSAPTGNVTISGACIANTYTVSTTLTNGTYRGATSIAYGGTDTVTLSANTGYSLPSTVTVSGATSSYDSTTGVVSLSAPSGNVTISGACVQVQQQPAQTYTLTITADNTESYMQVNFAIWINDVLSGYYYRIEGSYDDYPAVYDSNDNDISNQLPIVLQDVSCVYVDSGSASDGSITVNGVDLDYEDLLRVRDDRTGYYVFELTSNTTICFHALID